MVSRLVGGKELNRSQRDGPVSYKVVGKVMAYQAYDG